MVVAAVAATVVAAVVAAVARLLALPGRQANDIILPATRATAKYQLLSLYVETLGLLTEQVLVYFYYMQLIITQIVGVVLLTRIHYYYISLAFIMYNIHGGRTQGGVRICITEIAIIVKGKTTAVNALIAANLFI